MPQERNALRVGVVTIFIVAAFFLILIWISQHIGGEMQTITIRFKSTPDMPTLVPGSAVLVGGHRVGKVVGVALEPIELSDPQTGKTTQAVYLVVEAEIHRTLALKTLSLIHI